MCAPSHLISRLGTFRDQANGGDVGVLGEVDPPGEPQDGEIVIQEGSAEPRVDDDLIDGGDDFIGVSVKIPNVIAKDYFDLMGKLPVESRSTNIICRMATRTSGAEPDWHQFQIVCHSKLKRRIIV